MAPLVRSAKHLQRKDIIIPFIRKQMKRECFLTYLRGHHNPDTKSKDVTKKKKI